MAGLIPGLVTTIIPVYNRPQLIVEAVQSVLNQSYRPFEIIVVDDGSVDDTAKVIAGMASRYPEIIHPIHRERGGPGRARESGRQIAKGEYIQYLDSDDILLPRKFELQVEGLRKRPDCGVSYGKTRYYQYGESPINTAWKRTGEKIDKMFPAFLKSRWWGTSTPLYRREVIDKAGSWHNLRNEEDWVYDCRVAALGTKLCWCDEFVSDQRDHEQHRLSRGGAEDPAKLRDRARARRLIYEHAIRAGISKEAPEMRVFARYAFLLARQCGVVGLVAVSQDLVELAAEAGGESLDLRLYRRFARLLGWGTAARAGSLVERLRL